MAAATPPYVDGHGLLRGKTAVVTAAAGTGIGFAVARRCVEEGARVLISDIHERRLAEAVEQLAEIGDEPPASVLCNVTKQEDVDELFAVAIDHLGHVDVLMNNAGLGGTANLVDMSDEQWSTVLDVTLTLVMVGRSRSAISAMPDIGIASDEPRGMAIRSTASWVRTGFTTATTPRVRRTLIDDARATTVSSRGSRPRGRTTVAAATSDGCRQRRSSGGRSGETGSSSSSSSSPESNSSKYRNDVASYTHAYVVANGEQGAFLSGVGDLARKRGITDWESDENTWTGIGNGLGKTKIDEVALAVYEKNWAGGDPEKTRLMRKGFHDAR